MFGGVLGETVGVESSIDILVPTAAPVIGRWYQQTSAATDGMAPHVTLLWPWVDAPVEPESVNRATTAVVGVAPFQITFARCGRFPGVLYLTPSPAAPVELLIRQLGEAFPDQPAYGGSFGAAPPPHLTVAKSADEAELDAIQAEVEAELRPRPLSVLVSAVSISEQGLGPRGTWAVRHEIPLA